MDRLKELKEAKAACQDVLDKIQDARLKLEKAEGWGFWDMFGGGFISSMAKRSNITEAKKDLHALSLSLKALADELDDVNMEAPEGPSNTSYDEVVDIFFDNIFTDIRVQDEIKKTQGSLWDLEDQIVAISVDLQKEIDRLS